MITAFRGNSALKDDIAYRAHLAAILRLENVGLLLGSGASVPAGGKVMRDLWADFVGSSPVSAAWLVTQKFVDAESVDSAANLTTPNVEILVDRLAIAMAEWERVQDAKLDLGKSVRADIFRAVVRASVLSKDRWTAASGVDQQDPGLAHHRSILQKLTAARQPGQSSPWVFTTNYDLAIEWAAESIDMSVVNGFLGLHNRKFSPQSFDLGYRNTQARGEARFGVYNIYLAKLHGSLTWTEVDGQYQEVQAARAWPEISKFVEGKNDTLNYLVLPSAAKYVQTVGFVLGELLRRFAEFLARPQTSLVMAGYGFGDEHINRLLTSALLNPTLQLIIYLPEFTHPSELSALPPAVRRLLALQSPRITFVGGGSGAHLDALAEHLPDPAIYDEGLKSLEMKLRELDKGDADAGSASP